MSRLRQAICSATAASFYLSTSFVFRNGISRALSTSIHSPLSIHSQNDSEALKPHKLLASPWSTTQLRGLKLRGADVELRDVDSGTKVNERFRTDEAVERVFAAEKTFTYLYTDDESGNIVLMEPDTYAQVDVPKHLFGDSYVYLQDDMKVSVQMYDERPMSASIPTRVTCTISEAPVHVKGASVTPQYKKAVLDNGLSIMGLDKKSWTIVAAC
ncbi:hypothetical protein DM860_008082 [Cuscuta australis]|uniref:Translation elongation factor P/YeiP central domain-containing protein n=1 Tax=Cuscuta australis TaxID=267555 RepID=A0A328D2B6_9ASTE|nr:hypothetical protein DM860_008082 [Cuscuta australis]